MKTRYNHFWNYELGREKEKYLYLLLEDLLSQMNYHQIYDITEIERVFGQVQRVLTEQLQRIRQNVQMEVGKAVQKGEYLEMKTQGQSKSVSMKAKMSKEYERMTKDKQQTSNLTKSKKNELKFKLKAQIDNKYKTNPQQPSQKPQLTNHNPIKNLQQNSSQQPAPQKSPATFANTTDSQPPTQLNLHSLLSNSICCSPSFQHNMLMYYVLILENVIRYETQLIKNPSFYSVYEHGVESFVFGNKVEFLLNEIRQKLAKDDKSEASLSFKQLNEQIEKEIQFTKIIKATAITAPSSKSNQHQLIDPHKLLTYLINYRHLKKSTPINHLLISYLKMISTKNDSESSGLNKLMVGLETEDKMMELAVGNKQFVKSLKQLYVEEKQKISEDEIKKLSDKDRIESKKKGNKQQKSLNCKIQELTDKPTYTLVECIFERIDNWYQNKNKPAQK